MRSFGQWRAGIVAAAVALIGVPGLAGAQQPPVVPPAQPPPPANPPPTAPLPASPLTLGGAITQAFGVNPAARSAQFQLVAAQQRLAQAQAQQRWAVTFSSSLSGSNAVIYDPREGETFGEVINTVTVPLPVNRKGRLAIAQATAQMAAAQAQVDSARLTLAGQVGTAFFDVLRKRALLTAAGETLNAANRQLADAEKRFRAGDVPELDVLRARVPVASAQAGVASAQTALMVAAGTLNALLVRPFDAEVSPVDATDVGPPPALPFTLDEARTQAVKNHPDLRAAAANVRAAEIAVSLAHTGRDAAYSLQASDTRSNDKTGFTRLDSVQATVTLPLSDGGLTRAQTKEAQANLDAARAQLQVARQTVETVVYTAYRNAEGALRQLEAARTAKELAGAAYEKASRGYETGLFSLTDALSAHSALMQANIAYIQAIYDAAAAIAALNNAVGILPK